MKPEKVLVKILAGSKHIRFKDFTGLVEAYGFHLDRTSGSHHIFTHSQVPELVNLQDAKGEIKPYQVKQFLKLVERYSLQLSK